MIYLFSQWIKIEGQMRSFWLPTLGNVSKIYDVLKDESLRTCLDEEINKYEITYWDSLEEIEKI
jgi:hypothetical protein